ncbi:hypothetical protein ACCS96_51695, partial [Rhizobium ruizarguesonis]
RGATNQIKQHQRQTPALNANSIYTKEFYLPASKTCGIQSAAPLFDKQHLRMGLTDMPDHKGSSPFIRRSPAR